MTNSNEERSKESERDFKRERQDVFAKITEKRTIGRAAKYTYERLQSGTVMKEHSRLVNMAR